VLVGLYAMGVGVVDLLRKWHPTTVKCVQDLIWPRAKIRPRARRDSHTATDAVYTLSGPQKRQVYLIVFFWIDNCFSGSRSYSAAN
jgi:hypothetical protein